MPSQAVSRTLTAATVAFLAAFLLIGLLVHRDYGISWDEMPTRQFGVMYVQNQVPDAHALDSLRADKGTNFERFGPLWEIGLVSIEKALQPIDIRSVFFMRHLATFLTYFLGVVLFHQFCRRRFGQGLSLLATVCLVLSPQLFSHAFYNVKDIAFLTMFVASMLTLDTLLARPAWSALVVHALTTVILLGTRVLGVFAMLLTGVSMLARHQSRRTLGLLVGYGVLVTVLLPFVWPVLFIDYFGIVRDAVTSTTTNPYRGTNLFRGQAIDASALPADYVPTWIAITTPLVVLALFLAGAGQALVRFARAPREHIFGDRQRDLLVLCWFFMPVLGTVVLRPIMYDTWRHLFFVYPALVYIAAIGMEAVAGWATGRFGTMRAGRVHAALTAALLLALSPVLAFMVRNHPFEHVYFNRLAGRDMQQVKQRFELDYWGLSYRPLLEHIVRTDTSRVIRIYATTYPGRVNVAMLLPSERARVMLVGTPEEADYFVTNYRYHPEEYPFSWKVFSVDVGNASIGSAFESAQHRALRAAAPVTLRTTP